MPTSTFTDELRTGARDECGVVAVYAREDDVARLCYYGLYALQHRGQESAGIAASDGEHILVTKEMGLVNQVFNEARLAGLAGHLGIGHVRYSTTGASTWDNAQPAFKVTPAGSGLALAHNGNLVNTAELAASVEPEQRAAAAAQPRRGRGWDRDGSCATDSDVLATLLASGNGVGVAGADQPSPAVDGSLEEGLARVCALARGAFSLVVMDQRTIYGARDPAGLRPLVIGRLPRGGYVLASETSALDITGAHLVREVAPGEIVAVDEDGLRSRRFAEADPAACVFEYVYLARPDHRAACDDGQGAELTSVYAARRRMGELLAAEAPAEADLVIPVPDSGTPAASGYAAASGIPYAEGLVKNRYVGRTFIEPSQSLRQLGIRLKLNPLRDILDGKRLVVVDDSIVRGNTSRELVRMLRESGAAEVHLRITAPPIRNPCYYGIDMATRAELVASGLSTPEVREFVGADSLAYLSLDAMVSTTGRAKQNLCRACMDGHYPIPVPGEHPGTAEDTLTLFELDR